MIQVSESFIVSRLESKETRKVLEGHSNDISCIYPMIRAITANKPTRNKTYYPAENLIGDEKKGSGVYSLLTPYPVPIIQNHNVGEDFPDPSPVYGRVKFANFVKNTATTGEGGYVSIVPEISDPKAIDLIMSDRFLTVSIGVETESVTCSICGKDIHTCDHTPGATYKVGNQDVECVKIIGPLWFREISFVTIPSDETARVLQKNVQEESFRILGAVDKNETEIELPESREEFKIIKEEWSKPMKQSMNSQEEVVVQVGSIPSSKVLTTEPKKPEHELEHSQSSSADEQSPSLSQKDTKVSTDGKEVTAHIEPLENTSLVAKVKKEKKKYEEGGPITFLVLEDVLTNSSYSFLVTASRDSVLTFYSGLKEAEIPKRFKKILFSELSKFCVKNAINLPEVLKKYEGRENEDTRNVTLPLRISVAPTNYSWLLKLMTRGRENKMKENSVQSTKVNVASAIEKPLDVGDVSKNEQKENTQGLDVHSHKEPHSNAKSVKEEDAALSVKESVVLKEAVTALRRQVGILNKECMEMASSSHLRLAEEVAVLSQILRKVTARNKSLKELTLEFSKRTTHSLEDLLADLHLEFTGEAIIPISSIEKAASPVLKSDEMKSLPEDTAKVGKVSPVIEEEEESTYLFYGMTPDKVEKKIKELMESSSK
jgi:hypothetical protein